MNSTVQFGVSPLDFMMLCSPISVWKVSLVLYFKNKSLFLLKVCPQMFVVKLILLFKSMVIPEGALLSALVFS